MFLPTGDIPNPRNFTPWVTWGLIAVNVAIFVFITLPLSNTPIDPRDPVVVEYVESVRHAVPPGVTLKGFLNRISAYDVFLFQHGFKPGAAEWRDIFFSMFLHGGLAHLLGNMLFLWIYGDNVEHRLGRFRFLFAYLLTGLAATLFFSAMARGSRVPMVGASGAISGVLGLYFLLFPRNQVKVFVFFFPFIMQTILLPARWVLGIYLLLDNLVPVLIGAGGGVAYGAHIGGFLAGWGLAAYGERFAWGGAGKLKWKGVVPDKEDKTVARDELPALLREAIRSRDVGRSLHLASLVSSQHLANLPPADCVQLSGWIEEGGQGDSSAFLLRGCLGRLRVPEDRAIVLAALGQLRHRQGQDTTAYQHFLEALDETNDPALTNQIRNALTRIEHDRR